MLALQDNPADLPKRGLCTDCGISRTKHPKRCGQACQFIKPDYPAMEQQAHGRTADPQAGDARFFGHYLTMHQARLRAPKPGAQWTGITSRIGEKLLEVGKVDAVLTLKQDPDDPFKGTPVLVTKPEDMAACRGMRMGYAPLLSLLEPAIDQGLKRLAVIGIPCQIYALRRLEQSLTLDQLYVIGTPCSDNTSLENFHRFLALLTDQPDTVTYLEFRADYHVEIRFKDGRVQTIPFLKLPLASLPADFFPLTCRTCVDYTNRLSDVTVGYMAGRGDQWLVVRNQKGAEIVDLLADELALAALTSAGNRRSAVRGFLANTKRAAGGLPLRAMPDWLRPIVAWLMPRTGPRGLEFARARVEMKAIETILHLAHHKPGMMANMIPEHVWRLAQDYGLNADDFTKPPAAVKPRL